MFTSHLNRTCCGQDLAACLEVLGPLLDTLYMKFWGGDASESFTDESLHSLWTCSNLRSLRLEVCTNLNVADLEAGWQHLRSAATTPLTLTHLLLSVCSKFLSVIHFVDSLRVWETGNWRP